MEELPGTSSIVWMRQTVATSLKVKVSERLWVSGPMDDLISSQVSRVLEKALDGVSKRHTAIAGNIANAETPGYNAINLEFEDNLKQAIDAENASASNRQKMQMGQMRTSNDKHFNPGSFVTHGAHSQNMIERVSFDYTQKNKGVDIESQMAYLTKNSMQYSALTRLEGRAFNALRSVIKSSGGG